MESIGIIFVITLALAVAVFTGWMGYSLLVNTSGVSGTFGAIIEFILSIALLGGLFAISLHIWKEAR